MFTGLLFNTTNHTVLIVTYTSSTKFFFCFQLTKCCKPCKCFGMFRVFQTLWCQGKCTCFPCSQAYPSLIVYFFCLCEPSVGVSNLRHILHLPYCSPNPTCTGWWYNRNFVPYITRALYKQAKQRPRLWHILVQKKTFWRSMMIEW